MPSVTFLRTHRTKALLILFFAGLITAGMVCSPREAQVIQAPAPAVSLPEQPAQPFTPEVITLQPAAAARIDQDIRQSVPVQVADGFTLQVWAPDSLVKDPVALDVDDHGRIYYTRSNRMKHSEFDIRGHQDWMVRSIQFESVEDRRNFLHTELAPERSAQNLWMADLNGDGSHDWHDLTVEKEEIYRLEDTDHDGRADRSTLFAKDFNTEVTDVAAGIMADGDDIYVTVAPDLWRLRDTNGDGMADVKTSISHGYQVHIGFGGHGLSGPIKGPDGRLYWNVGDIAMNVVAPDGSKWPNPYSGAILRCNPDGSDFEIFAHGIRNTHEFGFDEYGNLIAVDNDGDHPGEHERVVYLTDGSDSGWRSNWQYGKYVDPDNNTYKVWMDEDLHKPRWDGQAAYITPAISLYHSGPSGFLHNPGTALGEKWRDYFFVGEFTGSPNSKIHAFRLEPKGATFTLAQDTTIVKGLNATGFAFGPDGALYFGDWVDGWDAKNEGRIWKLDVENPSPLRDETQALMAASFDGKSAADLLDLLKYPDQRIRLKAQFELADRGDAETLQAAARQTENQIARLHGLWGLGQLARQDPKQAASLTAFLTDADHEVRAQAAKVLGDVGYAPAADALVALLKDEAPRARFFAADALGRIGYHPAIQPIIDMLEANNDVDAYLRHAGTLALARIGDAEPVLALADSPSRALRIAAVVALRRMHNPSVARFLQDQDEFVVTAAARAINDDASIEAAVPDLARVLETTPFSNEPLIRRAINANLRVGTPEAARRVAAYAARPDAPEEMRSEALATLGVWPHPSPLDRVDGRHRDFGPRNAAVPRDALASVLDRVISTGTTPVKIATAEAVGRLEPASGEAALMDLLASDASPDVRIAALAALQKMESSRLQEAVHTALADRDQTVRMAALRSIPSLDLPEAAVAEMLASVLEQGSTEEQQSAFAALGQLAGPHVEQVLAHQVDRLADGTLPAEVQLDLIEAVDSSRSAALKSRVDQYRATKPATETVAAYSEALYGGDPAQGRRIFYRHPGAMCTRCHAIDGRGGDVGPDLTQVGARSTREYLLQSLIDPSAKLAPGYGATTLTLKNGDTVSGKLMRETDDSVILLIGTDETRRVQRDLITRQDNVPSAMPPMGHVLTRHELRDVVAFLSGLR